jgi:beta-phosphoglucomutase
MKYKAVIFDLDGVICHTDRFHYLAWKEMAERLGIEFNERINDRLRGVSRMESAEIVLENYGGKLSLEEKEAFANEKNEIYKKLLLKMSPADLSEDVKNTMEKLRANGILLAIGSSSKNARLILERIGLKDYFDAVSVGDNIKRSKPDPEVFIKAREMLGVEPHECLVVEDAEAGVKAALAGGMECAVIGPVAKAMSERKASLSSAGMVESADDNLTGKADKIYVLERFSDLVALMGAI